MFNTIGVVWLSKYTLAFYHNRHHPAVERRYWRSSLICVLSLGIYALFHQPSNFLNKIFQSRHGMEHTSSVIAENIQEHTWTLSQWGAVSAGLCRAWLLRYHTVVSLASTNKKWVPIINSNSKEIDTINWFALSLSHTHTLSLSHTHSLSHTLSLSHTHTLSLTHTRSLSLQTHTHPHTHTQHTHGIQTQRTRNTHTHTHTQHTRTHTRAHRHTHTHK